MKNKNQQQQGDIILNKIDKLPEGKKEVVSRGNILVMHGESGHSHTIESDISDAELIRIGERILLRVNTSVTLKHEEHRPFVIEPGIWEVGQVVEKDWLADMVRPVVD
jgi:hypothetical protein